MTDDNSTLHKLKISLAEFLRFSNNKTSYSLLFKHKLN